MPEASIPGHWSTFEYAPSHLPGNLDELLDEQPDLAELVAWWRVLRKHPTLPDDIERARMWVIDNAAVSLAPTFPTACENGMVRRDVLLSALGDQRSDEMDRVFASYKNALDLPGVRDISGVGQQWRLLQRKMGSLCGRALNWLLARYVLRPKRGLHVCSPWLMPQHISCALIWAMRLDWEAGISMLAQQPDVGHRWLTHPVRAEAWLATCLKDEPDLPSFEEHPRYYDRWLSGDEQGLTLRQCLYHDPDRGIPATPHTVFLLHKWPGRSNTDVRRALNRAIKALDEEGSARKKTGKRAAWKGRGRPTDYMNLMAVYRTWWREVQSNKRLTREVFLSRVHLGTITIEGWETTVLDTDYGKSLDKARRWLEPDHTARLPWEAPSAEAVAEAYAKAYVYGLIDTMPADPLVPEITARIKGME